MSVYGSIIAAVQTTIQNLGIQFNSVSVPVVERKLPKAEETLDTLPLIAITPSVTEIKWRRVSFELDQEVIYPVQIAIIAAGNRDLTSNIDTYTGWYQQIRNAFLKPPLAGVSQVWRTQVRPGKVFDRALLNLDYDYLTLEVLFWTLE